MRLIDADKLLEQNFKNDISYNAFKNLVKRQTTIEIVKCKNCKWLSMTTIGMDYACWHGAYELYGETGENAGHRICKRIEDLDWFCADGERRTDNAVD